MYPAESVSAGCSARSGAQWEGSVLRKGAHFGGNRTEDSKKPDALCIHHSDPIRSSLFVLQTLRNSFVHVVPQSIHCSVLRSCFLVQGMCDYSL